MLRLGKKSPKRNSKTLLLKKYTAALPGAPPKVFWEFRVKSWPMYLNDQLGDCVFACGGHMLENWSAHTGAEVSPSDSEILAAYETVGGYDPNDPSTDNGAAITDFLNWWQKNPLTGSKNILGWASVNPRNLREIKQAIYLFGGIDIGINVPQSAIDQANGGQPWDVVPNSPIVGGHSIPVLGYGSAGCACITWGAIQRMSWEFFSTFCDEAYAVITQDWLDAQGKSPSGFDLATLQADLAAL